jgi:hypothetical protein
MIRASDCICGRHLLQELNEGTCLLCGHGLVRSIREHAYRRNLEHNRAPALSTTGMPRFDLAVARAVATPNNGGRWGARSVRVWDAGGCVEAARRWEAERGHLPTSGEWQAPLDGVERPTYTTVHRMFGGWRAFLREIADVPRERAAA